MSGKAVIPWVWSIACALLAGCGGVSVSLLFFDEPFHRDHHTALAFQEVVPVVPSAINAPREVVVRDLVAWDGLWRAHTASTSPAVPLPGINFSQSMVIGVFLGSRNSACHSVRIDAIEQIGPPERIVVTYREIPPLTSTNCPAAPHNPAMLVALDFSHLPVEFFRVN